MSLEHWIKVKKILPDSPKMRALSSKCKCSVAEAFLGWFKLYCYFDSHTANGTVEYFSQEDVNYISGVQGMAQALVDIKWIEFHKQDCIILEWEKHNGQSAKCRMLQSERQVKSRKNKELQNV